MGSHGGGTTDGQKQILASMGIVEDLIGIPVLATMDVIQIGQTDDGVPVYMDKNAYQADMIVLINRIKPHTDFIGDFESGLCKMMAIGLGKHIGCSRLHQEGFENFHNLIPSVAKVFLKKANIGFGVAILENAYDQTYQIKAIKANKIMTEEPKLLKKAKQLMPRIMVPEIDVLIIEKIGKDISGAGMDTNIIGRTTKGPMLGFNGPTIQQIIILDLTYASHGNACGVGLANFITKSMYDKIDHVSTYANVIASGNPNAGRIPVIMNTEKEAIVAATRCCSQIDITNPRIVRILDTLHLETIWVSEKIYNEINSNTQIELC
ncbi:protein of unknown function [Megasphaera paucivorans]|uniref:LarA-like N-terminal domain-containing protein n=2 Tax=Megasphaera paucivorans TaxID=349095 RepID=A0A1G9WWQ3_9FIRM|nr:protein of unknown function [Megasphaera paucivorans]